MESEDEIESNEEIQENEESEVSVEEEGKQEENQEIAKLGKRKRERKAVQVEATNLKRNVEDSMIMPETEENSRDSQFVGQFKFKVDGIEKVLCSICGKDIPAQGAITFHFNQN